jgi:hypothetical protein
VELLVSKSIFDVVLWMLVIWLPSILRIACSFEVIVPQLIAKYTGHGLVCSALYFCGIVKDRTIVFELPWGFEWTKLPSWTHASAVGGMKHLSTVSTSTTPPPWTICKRDGWYTGVPLPRERRVTGQYQSCWWRVGQVWFGCLWSLSWISFDVCWIWPTDLSFEKT